MFTAIFKVKTAVKGDVYSGFYIRTAINNLQWFSTKPLLNFVALPITAVVQPL
jgi:hypothetical protein